MSTSQLIEFTIDGRKVSVPAGTTIFDAARANNIAIPTLCNQQNETPVGVCRVCVVDVGARVYAASCIRPVEPGMVVNTASDGVKRARHTLVELLMSDHPSPCARERQSGDCELEALAKHENITHARYPPRATRRGPDNSSMSIAVDFEACILCDRCVRGCNDIRENFVLGRMGKGASTGIAFDNNEPMGESSCVSCGECMVSCPTGALTNRLVTQTEIAVTPRLRAGAAPRTARASLLRGSFRNIFELESQRGGPAAFQAWRNHLPRRRVRIHGVLFSGGSGEGFHRQPHRAREDQRRGSQVSWQAFQPADAAPERSTRRGNSAALDSH